MKTISIDLNFGNCMLIILTTLIFVVGCMLIGANIIKAQYSHIDEQNVILEQFADDCNTSMGIAFNFSPYNSNLVHDAVSFVFEEYEVYDMQHNDYSICFKRDMVISDTMMYFSRK